MAKKDFLVNIDLFGNELLRARLQNLSTAPAPFGVGHIYFDTTLNSIGVWNGTAWVYDQNTITNIIGSAPINVSIDVNGVATITISNATALASGAMSATDKAKLDASTSANTASTLVERDANGDFSANNVSLQNGTVANAPVNANDIVRLTDLQAIQSGLNVKAPVKTLADANVALTGLQTINGYTLVDGDTLWATAQTNPIENGIWVAHAGAWTRPTYFANGSEQGNSFAFVEDGTYANSGWVVNGVGTAVVGTDAISVVQFTATAITAGAGMVQVGNQFNVVNNDGSITVGADEISVNKFSAGAIGLADIAEGGGIKVNTDNDTIVIDGVANVIKTSTNIAKVVNKEVTIGDDGGGAPVLSAEITHNLNTKNLSVVAQRVSDGAVVDLGIVMTSVNVVTVSVNAVVPVDTYNIAIVGNVGTTLP